MNAQQRHSNFRDRLFGIALTAGICASGCSFKDFDYLQQGSGGASTNAGSDAGGNSGSGQGGESKGGTSASTGGTTSTSAAGGATAGQGGTASTGTSTGAVGGTSSSGGNTSTGGSAQGGTSGGTTVPVATNLLTNPSFESDSNWLDHRSGERCLVEVRVRSIADERQHDG
ncbi:MAG: hypothetical protein QM784_35400 [Polyangiaceae bacterium]